MINLTGYEECLYKRAICLLSQSGMTNDPEERIKLLKEVLEVIENIKEETEKRR